jgi:hypothetical protein
VRVSDLTLGDSVLCLFFLEAVYWGGPFPLVPLTLTVLTGNGLSNLIKLLESSGCKQSLIIRLQCAIRPNDLALCNKQRTYSKISGTATMLASPNGMRPFTSRNNVPVTNKLSVAAVENGDLYTLLSG